MKDFTSLIDELDSWVKDTKGHEIPVELYILLCTSEEAIKELQIERDTLRNELCLRCGEYTEAHNGACDGCKWRAE